MSPRSSADSDPTPRDGDRPQEETAFFVQTAESQSGYSRAGEYADTLPRRQAGLRRRSLEWQEEIPEARLPALNDACREIALRVGFRTGRGGWDECLSRTRSPTHPEYPAPRGTRL